MRLLVVDDDAAIVRSLTIEFERTGHVVRTAGTAREAIAACNEAGFDAVFADLRLPDGSGLDVLAAARGRSPDCPVVLITGEQDMQATIEAARRGAFDYIRKPLDLETLEATLARIAQAGDHGGAKTVRLADTQDAGPHELVGADRRIIEVLKQLGSLSTTRVPVLIEGESGTGKELVARALHRAGCADEPFVAVNCSAVVSTLLESELFGHEKGAFTGAETAKVGRLEQAGRGTIFLDEIGDMAVEMQAKLLRALQEKSFERVGGLQPIALAARVVAATNQDLALQVEKGAFREDLYFRLAVSRIVLPPLRERRADVPLLVRHLLPGIRREVHKPIEALEEAALARLVAYDWPGNVRELCNVLTRAVLLVRGTVLTDECVAAALGARPDGGDRSTGPVRPLREVEREHIRAALAALDWNITRTAAALEISPTTLRKKIDDYGLRREA